MATNGKLKGKSALITGGGGGIGSSMARVFAESGARVVITDVQESGRAVAEEVGGSFVQADIADMDETRQMCRRVIELEGAVDILVNNAGLQRIAPIEEFPEDEWARLLQIMLIAPFQLTKYFVPGMKERGWGRVIFLGTVGTEQPGQNNPDYYASKAALPVVVRSLAKELRNSGVTANLVSPGIIATDEVRTALEKRAGRHDIQGWNEVQVRTDDHDGESKRRRDRPDAERHLRKDRYRR